MLRFHDCLAEVANIINDITEGRATCPAAVRVSLQTWDRVAKDMHSVDLDNRFIAKLDASSQGILWDDIAENWRAIRDEA